MHQTIIADNLKIGVNTRERGCMHKIMLSGQFKSLCHSYTHLFFIFYAIAILTQTEATRRIPQRNTRIQAVGHKKKEPTQLRFDTCHTLYIPVSFKYTLLRLRRPHSVRNSYECAHLNQTLRLIHLRIAQYHNKPLLVVD